MYPQPPLATDELQEDAEYSMKGFFLELLKMARETPPTIFGGKKKKKGEEKDHNLIATASLALSPRIC